MLDGKIKSEALEAQLAVFRKNIREHQRVARFMAQAVRKYARANIRNQQTVDGEPFEPRRKKQRAKRRMLLGLAPSMGVKSYAGAGGGAGVGWYNKGIMGRIAARQQYGQGEDWNPAKIRRVRGVPNYKSPATAKQDRALRKAGFRRAAPGKGGGRRLARVKAGWIQEHLSLGQAGLILRLLRDGAARGKQSWRDDVPPRPFLGVNSGQVAELLDLAVDKFLNGVGKTGAGA